MKKLIHTAGGIFVAALLALVQPVYAKTPDGKTPAEETVCNPLREATAGLYGLCVAFCEAHDADLVDPSALRRPDLKILENYDRKRREGDPPMPCLIQPPEDDGPTGSDPVSGTCPCWTAVQLEEMLPPINNTDLPVAAACINGDTSKYLYNFEQGPTGPRFTLNSDRFEGCMVDKTDYPLGAPAGFGFDLTAEEVAACDALLVNHARKYSQAGVWDCFDTP
jgi:hypothetical protein